jgi:tRNA G10  N-methylase Trm11
MLLLQIVSSVLTFLLIRLKHLMEYEKVQERLERRTNLKTELIYRKKWKSEYPPAILNANLYCRESEPMTPHIPQCIPYPMTDILRDLVIFAAQRLVFGGRLVYWLPTTREYKDSDLPQHPCLEIVSNSEQPLSRRTSRRLITMSKILEYNPEAHDKITKEDVGSGEVAHSKIADKWLKRVDVTDK